VALRPSGTRWQIIPKAGTPVEVDRVVVAAPAHAAAALLGDTFGSAARDLTGSQATSSVTVSLAFARGAVEHALDATGFVVAEPAQAEGFRACTFVSSKLRGRAPSNAALLRLFFRPTQIDLASLDDAGWAERALRSSSRALDIRSSPERAWVSRWVNALPVFDDAHRQRVARLEEELQGTGISVTGASFHGSGIDGAVRSAEAFVARNGYTTAGHPSDFPVQAVQIFDVFLSDQELIEQRRGLLEPKAIGVEDKDEAAYWVYFESIGQPHKPRIVAVADGEAFQVFHMSYGRPDRSMKRLPHHKAPPNKSLERTRER
jgi:hypothetical protein